MLDDLRKYITDTVKIDEYSVAWYFKEFMERCKDNKLVNTLMDNITENSYIIRDNEINPFEFLIADYHMTDVFAVDNVIIKLILSCVTTQFIISDCRQGMLESFFRYTKRGRKLSGYTHERILADYLIENWSDLEDEFSGITDDELIKILKTNDADDMTYDYDFYSMVIVVDEREVSYLSIYQILNTMGFSEVCPGLFYYGGFGCSGYGEADITLNAEDVEDIYDEIALSEKDRNLDGNELSVFNEMEADDYLFMLLRSRSSMREVLF